MADKELFLKNFLKHNKLLFGFIVAMVPNHTDAEDILQETAIILWNKFDAYEPGTNFYAWAKQVAKNKVYEYYKTQKRFNSTDLKFLEIIQEINEPMLDTLEQRMAALRGCVSKLDRRDVLLIQARFQKNLSLKKLAEQNNQSVHTLYKRLAHVFALLRTCTQKTLIAWDS
jgi:RNA polymerase sigma-70 factor (ECF subfamily)